VGFYKDQLPDFFEHVFHSQQGLVIPKAYDPKSLSIQRRRPSFVIFRALEMLRAIELDDQSLIYAAEVDDIGTNWMLATKFETVELVPAKFGPKRILRIALIAPKPSRLIAFQTVWVSFLVKHIG
jgi:hypothetical protein